MKKPTCDDAEMRSVLSNCNNTADDSLVVTMYGVGMGDTLPWGTPPPKMETATEIRLIPPLDFNLVLSDLLQRVTALEQRVHQLEQPKRRPPKKRTKR